MRGARQLWTVSATVGGLWLVTVALSAVVSLTPLSRVQQAVLPTVTPYVWSWAAPWPVLLPVAGAVAVVVVHAAILHFVRSRAPFATTWLSAVVAGAAVGMTLDATLVFGSIPTAGWAAWVLDLGSRAAVGAYWGLLYGWIAGLVALRLAQRPAGAGAPDGSPRRIVPVACAVAGLVLLGATQMLGDEATQAQLRAEAATSEPAPVDGAARPDPDAAGDPVPARAEGAGLTGADACAPDRATLLVGDVDGATGHRGLRLELINGSDSPCVIEGYPDIAFGDQNENLLDVAIERGSSFMTSDPGTSRVEVPAGGSAVAFLGWDANSTQGALVARTLWVAPLAGETRGSKAVDSDVIAGSSVTVTAWALPTVEPVAP